MANHPNRSGAFELSFWGLAPHKGMIASGIKFRARHTTLEAAKAEADRVLAKLPNRGAHPAVIYQDGKSQPVASVF